MLLALALHAPTAHAVILAGLGGTPGVINENTPPRRSTCRILRPRVTLLAHRHGGSARSPWDRTSAPSPDDRGAGRGDTSGYGVTVTVVLEALQLLASSVSTTVFGPCAQAST